jgi:prophage antirepressor-like protein
MSTGRWSELSGEQDVRATESGIYLVIMMSGTSGVAEGLYGFVVAIITEEIPPSRGQPRVPVDMLGV